MGWITIPKPGDDYGPCPDEACKHRDCAANRRDAMWVCRLCGLPIGYDTKCYGDAGHPEWKEDGGGRQLVHAVCLWREKREVRP